MKKVILGATLLAGLMFTTSSCGGGKGGDVNQDTVISHELTDSMSRALGAFMGVNLQGEVGYSNNIDDYIEGYQLVAGHTYSREKLMGMRAGMYAADQFLLMAAQGIDVNRDQFLQEFRKYLQKSELTGDEYKELYMEYQRIMSEVEKILIKRDELRLRDGYGKETPQEADQTEVVVDETVVEEVTAPQDSNNQSELQDEIIEEIL